MVDATRFGGRPPRLVYAATIATQGAEFGATYQVDGQAVQWEKVRHVNGDSFALN